VSQEQLLKLQDTPTSLMMICGHCGGTRFTENPAKRLLVPHQELLLCDLPNRSSHDAHSQCKMLLAILEGTLCTRGARDRQ